MSLKLLKDYQIIVLGEREFCGVELGRWLSQEQQVYLSLRLKKNEYVELEEQNSSFSIGLHGQNWLDSIAFFQDVVQELICFYPHQQSYYRKGMRAVSLIQSAL